ARAEAAANARLSRLKPWTWTGLSFPCGGRESRWGAGAAIRVEGGTPWSDRSGRLCRRGRGERARWGGVVARARGRSRPADGPDPRPRRARRAHEHHVLLAGRPRQRADRALPRLR